MLIKIGSALIDPEEIVAVKPYPDESQKICVILRNTFSILTDATMNEAEAALIDAGVMTDLNADQGEDGIHVPDLTDEEIEKLCELEADGYQYVARDKNGKLYAYRERPEYDGFYWNIPGNLSGDGTTSVDGNFAFICNDDEEPVRISTLLGHLS